MSADSRSTSRRVRMSVRRLEPRPRSQRKDHANGGLRACAVPVSTASVGGPQTRQSADLVAPKSLDDDFVRSEVVRGRLHLLETGVVYCDDNLHRLSLLPSESVSLIYLDPPFFSNRQYEVIWGDEAE